MKSHVVISIASVFTWELDPCELGESVGLKRNSADVFLAEVRQTIEEGRQDYNEYRPK